MAIFKAEANSDIQFAFPDDLVFDKLDEEGRRLPIGLKLVDIVIEQETKLLLVEIKDYSHINSRKCQQEINLKRLTSNEIVFQDLTPKARDSYTFLHLMKKDTKDMIYIVLLCLEAYDDRERKAILLGFKDKLFNNIRHEADKPWVRQHIQNCSVLTIEDWNRIYPEWLVTRLSSDSNG